MKTEHIKTTITGTVTNDCWGGESYGHGDVKYLHCSETHANHDLTEILAELVNKKVKITIETID